MNELPPISSLTVSRNNDSVSIVRKIVYTDGTYSYHDLFDGRLTPAEAVVLSGELLKNAGAVLQSQGKQMQPKRRVGPSRKSQQETPQ